MKIMSLGVVGAFVVLALFVAGRSAAQPQLKVNYGDRGIQTLSYGTDVLEDLAKYPGDAFHIWHIQMTDTKGQMISTGDYGWGENARERVWDAPTQTWKYKFTWGSISVRFLCRGSNLQMLVTEQNDADSGVILQGAQIFPFGVHFPQLPKGFGDPSYPQLANNTTGPSATLADYGSGELVAVVSDPSKPLYSGFLPVGGGGYSYTPLISSTSPDGLATFQPHNDRPVLPGQSDTFTVALRFAPAGTSVATIASDAYAAWGRTWPAELNWIDRRPIGTVFLASSPSGDVHHPGGYPNNPRRYFNDGDASHFDVNSTAGLAAFQARVLQQAQSNVDNLTRLGAQGSITWDIEGQQYPHDTSYVCEPDQVAQVAPEMESVVSDPASPYRGMKLDDAYFKIMTTAGFRVGVCLRPQHFSINADGTAQQTFLPNDAVAAELLRKMKFAHDRWGATLFYVDSTVESNGAVLDAGIFQQIARAFPDSLIMPEESTYKHYAYTAPFQSFIFHGDLGTDSTVHAAYPKAFSVNLINDVSAASLASQRPALTASVKNGDVLMGHAGYWQENDPTIVAIYQEASSSAPPPQTTAPVANPGGGVLSTVAIANPSEGSTVSGTISVIGSQFASGAAAFYLLVDGAQLGTTRVSETPFQYDLDSTALANGLHTLQLWAQAAGSEAVVSSPVKITVANAPKSPVEPVPAAPSPSSFPIMLTYPVSGQTVSGQVVATGAIPQTLDAAGSYLMVDGVQVGSQRVGSAPYAYALDTTLLNTGTHILQLWAHDIGNNTLLSNQVTITVTR